MCGRYTLKDKQALERAIAELIGRMVEVKARYNVSPSQEVPVIALAENGKPEAKTMRWGLIPAWDKSEKPKLAPINARAEDAFNKPMFRSAIQKRRCLVPADAFYEWKNLGTHKQPYAIAMKNRAPFFFAGIYEEATAIRPDTFALFTTAPNAVMVPIHHRMPAIIPLTRVQAWLGVSPLAPDSFTWFMQPYSADFMEAWPVSTLVNKPMNDVPECLEPASLSPIVEKKEGELF